MGFAISNAETSLDCRRRISYTEPMKKPSSGLGVGLWVVGGLVGMYLLGALAIYGDYRFNRFGTYVALPWQAKKTLGFIYTPLFTSIQMVWPGLFRDS
jgi:hypothetical protein